MSTYSFADVTATLDAPGASIAMGAGAGNAEEGITISYSGDRTNMMVGADGNGMHSKIQDVSGTITVRLLKTSSTNAKLVALLNVQDLDTAQWGDNVIVVENTLSGDKWAAREVAFGKIPDFSYAQEGDTIEWEFKAIKINSIVGTY